ncbi:uncharacterized protein LOC142982775 [Anticarsia gemmatalis]|uniref:uncharacterized protein LOC142982775 n=1 Tax=Anticarsia gemmatalis TaxID=129554 RepID=UPI003F76FBED
MKIGREPWMVEMRGQIFFMLASLLCSVTGAAVDPQEDTEVLKEDYWVDGNHNVNVGWIEQGNFLLFRRDFYMAPMSFITHRLEFTFTEPNIVITAIQATEKSFSKGAYVKIIAGGVNRNSVSFRLTSETGKGFFFLVQVWGYRV